MQHSEVVSALSEARFVPNTRRRPAVSCAAAVVACFRVDGCLLMVQRHPPDGPWDLPHSALPPGALPPDATLLTLRQLTAQLVYEQSGVRLAQAPALFGYIDWGPVATRAGWGWTACLRGEVATIEALPAGARVGRRAFVPPGLALDRVASDAWTYLRRACLEAAFAADAAARDFWLLQPLDALALTDLEDVLD